MTEYKVLTLEQLLSKLGHYNRSSVKVVHCHGCFDPLHVGHIVHLEAARALGDTLVVTVTADEYVAKGPGRPVLPQELRARALAGLEAVDWVVVNNAATAALAINAIRPAFYVKGKEFQGKMTRGLELEEAAVEAVGGKLAFTETGLTYSSTQLLERMRNDPREEVACQDK